MPVATQNKIMWSCALSFVVGFSMAFSDRSWRTAPCGRLVAVRRPARYAAGGGGGGFGGLGGGGFGGLGGNMGNPFLVTAAPAAA